LEHNDSRPSTSTQNEIDDKEDDVIKAILRSKEIVRTHPPNISLKNTLFDICFHPIKDFIALGSVTGDVLIYKYDNEKNKLVSTFELHKKACRDIEFNDEGTILYSVSKDKTIMLSDFETEKLITIFENAHDNPIYTMTVIDEHTFATGDDEGTVKLWDSRQQNYNSIFSIKEMDDFVTSMLTNEDKMFLVCTSGDGTLTTINMRTKKLHVQTEDYSEELTCLGLFKHGKKILAGGTKGNLYIFNWGEFGLHSDEIPSLNKNPINCMIPITENIVITGSEDQMLRATSIFPNQHLGIVGQHNLSVENLDICNNGTIIASYSYDGIVKFWNTNYFETLNLSNSIKGGKQIRMKYNLPSSKVDNASDFFADL
ncbi:PREDICTED: WD repeat-containing protein 55 homolog, partial [Ceratosolen solmsi marchali]|uniref:WD repeat-containing protein 55 homolog n=1 Tax=Ceratosolen solmsi marchali TaxID=326594 RepID=A0AAJ6YK58_9HYME